MPASTQPWTQSFQQFGQGLQALAMTGAIGVGALWTYWLFVRTRQHAPRAEVSQQAVFRKIDEGRSFIGVTLTIKNIGSVAINLASAKCVVQQLEPWPGVIPTKLCVPEISEPDADPSSGDLAWPCIAKCPVSLSGCHVEAGESQDVQFDFVVTGHPKCVHIYTHVENVKIRRYLRKVEVGWACRSTCVFEGNHHRTESAA